MFPRIMRKNMTNFNQGTGFVLLKWKKNRDLFERRREMNVNTI